MINVPEEIKTLLKQSSVQKNFRVSFPNGDHPDLTNTQVISESVEFTESLCSQDSLKFGLCEASTISFETFGVGNIKDKTIDCSLEILWQDYISKLSYSIDSVWSPEVVWRTVWDKDDEDHNFASANCAYQKYESRTEFAFKNISLKSMFVLHIPIYRFTSKEKHGKISVPLHCTISSAISPSANLQFAVRLCIITESIYFDGYDVAGSCILESTGDYLLESELEWEQIPPDSELFIDMIMYSATNIDLTGSIGLSFGNDAITQQCSELVWNSYAIPYGRFTVESCPRDSSNLQKRKVSAYTQDGFSINTPESLLSVCSRIQLYEFDASHYTTGGSGDVEYKKISLLSNVFAAKQLEPTGTRYRINSDSRNNVYPYSYMSSDESSEISTSYCIYQYTSYRFTRLLGFNYAGIPDSDDTCVTVLRSLKLKDGCVQELNNKLQTFRSTIFNSSYTDAKKIAMFNNCMMRTMRNFNVPLNVTRDPAQMNLIIDAEFVGDYFYPIKDNRVQNPPKLYQQPIFISAASNIPGICTKIIVKAKDDNDNVVATVTFEVEFEDADGINFDVIVSDFPTIDYTVVYHRVGQTNEFVIEEDLVDTLNGDCRQLVEACAELSGAFFKLNRVTNQLMLLDINQGLGLYPADTVFPRDDLYPAGGNSSKSFLIDMSMYSKAWYDDYPTKRYSAITCTYTDTNNEKQTETYTIIDLTLTDDSGDLVFNTEDYQVYDISDNEIIRSNTYTQAQIQTILQTIATNIDDVIYMPADIDCVGLPYIEAGDVADVITADGSFETIVLRRTLSGIQALFDNYESK